MQFGIKAANYPLIPEDFERNKLPVELPATATSCSA
jgi:regulator of PEP synthase PpsR (kinase-PPPase family)